MKKKDDISQHSWTNKNRIKMLPESERTQLTLQYRQIDNFLDKLRKCFQYKKKKIQF